MKLFKLKFAHFSKNREMQVSFVVIILMFAVAEGEAKRVRDPSEIIKRDFDRKVGSIRKCCQFIVV